MQIIDYSTVGKRSGSRKALRMAAMERMADRMGKHRQILQRLQNLYIDLSRDISIHNFGQDMCLYCKDLHQSLSLRSLKRNNVNQLSDESLTMIFC